MGVEWGGKGPASPKESSKFFSRFDRLLDVAEDSNSKSAEQSSTPDIAQTIGELTTQEMLDHMQQAPKPPAKNASPRIE